MSNACVRVCARVSVCMCVCVYVNACGVECAILRLCWCACVRTCVYELQCARTPTLSLQRGNGGCNNYILIVINSVWGERCLCVRMGLRVRACLRACVA